MRPLVLDEAALERLLPKNRHWGILNGQAGWDIACMKLPDDFYIPTSEPGIWLKISLQLDGPPPQG